MALAEALETGVPLLDEGPSNQAQDIEDFPTIPEEIDEELAQYRVPEFMDFPEKKRRGRAGVEPTPMYLDPDLKNSGCEFLKYIHQNYTKKPPKITFAPQGLSTVLQNSFKENKPLLIYLHTPEHKNGNAIVKNVLESNDVSNLINSSFKSYGMLTNNPDIKLLSEWVQPKRMPCFLVLKKVSTQIRVDDLIPLGGDPSMLTSDFIHNSIVRYLTQRNPNFVIPRTGEMLMERQDQQAKVEKERREREEQNRKYLDMIHEEQKKHSEKVEKEKEETERKRKEDSIRKKAINKKKSYLSELQVEPQSGDIIKVAFRLPDATRVTRNFGRDEKAKVCVVDRRLCTLSLRARRSRWTAISLCSMTSLRKKSARR